MGNEEAEMNAALMAELDEMKEELSALPSDLDVLNWAQEKVFRTVVEEDGEEVYSSAYPHILAHTMRVLREEFNNPHLALALFQHAQSLSIDSYLAGCLTAAYNELLIARWEHFQDLVGVSQAVREMDANGVGWDRRTSKIIGNVCGEVLQGLDQRQHVLAWGTAPQVQVAALEKRLEQDNTRENLIARHKKMEARDLRLAAQGRSFDREGEATEDEQL
jgi:hypothetical protein